MKKLIPLLLIAGVVLPPCCVSLVASYHQDQTGEEAPPPQPQPQPKAPRPRPAPKSQPGAKAEQPAAAAVPKEGALYVWQLPEEGFQTLLVLRVTGPDTFEGAYLVPVRVKLPGEAPKDQSLAKKGAEALDAVVGGRLVNASLRGRTATGVQVADIHLGAGSKDDPKQPAGWLTELLIRQKHLARPPAPAGAAAPRPK